MAVRGYEGMFLLDSGRFATDPNGMTDELMALFARVNAEVVAHRPWQDGKLAYPVNGLRKGLHYLVYFKAESKSLEELYRLIRLNTNIMRHMVIQPPASLFDVAAAHLADPNATIRQGDEEEAKPVRRGPAANSDIEEEIGSL